MPREPREPRESDADADAEMEVDNLAAGGFSGWNGREQSSGPGGRWRVHSLLPQQQCRGPLRFRREGECPGTVEHPSMMLR